MDPGESIFAKYTQIWILTNLGPIQGHQGPENMSPGAYILQTSKCNSYRLIR